jgi:probable HAF family extracellular repeat protein
LGTIGNGSSFGRKINDAGQVVGYYYSTQIDTHAFRTAPNAAITAASDLGTLPGGSNSFAVGINSLGQTVGWSNLTATYGGNEHAFRTDPNGVITAASDIGTLGGSVGRAADINDSGVTVGLSFPAGSTTFHAFRTAPNGSITPACDLGTLGGSFSNALSVNNSGQTVGEANIADNSSSHAFIIDLTGPMLDLSDLIPAGTGWVLTDAFDITDAGQICGYGTINGQTHAYLLTPTPEPASLALVASTSFCLFARRRPQR